MLLEINTSIKLIFKKSRSVCGGSVICRLGEADLHFPVFPFMYVSGQSDLGERSSGDIWRVGLTKQPFCNSCFLSFVFWLPLLVEGKWQHLLHQGQGHQEQTWAPVHPRSPLVLALPYICPSSLADCLPCGDGFSAEVKTITLRRLFTDCYTCIKVKFL